MANDCEAAAAMPLQLLAPPAHERNEQENRENCAQLQAARNLVTPVLDSLVLVLTHENLPSQRSVALACAKHIGDSADLRADLVASSGR